MDPQKDQYQNEMVIYRRKMRLSRKRVARLLGQSSTAMLSRYENGRSYPPLVTGLRLEIIYRTPLAFLYHKLYNDLRDEIRKAEAAHPAPQQLALF
jgi:transcriptional regulator with XRE-family HTH domain